MWGAAYEFFGGGEEGRKACRAIGALAAVGQIDATITNFLVPLQVREWCDDTIQGVTRNQYIYHSIFTATTSITGAGGQAQPHPLLAEPEHGDGPPVLPQTQPAEPARA